MGLLRCFQCSPSEILTDRDTLKAANVPVRLRSADLSLQEVFSLRFAAGPLDSRRLESSQLSGSPFPGALWSPPAGDFFFLLSRAVAPPRVAPGFPPPTDGETSLAPLTVGLLTQRQSAVIHLPFELWTDRSRSRQPAIAGAGLSFQLFFEDSCFSLPPLAAVLSIVTLQLGQVAAPTVPSSVDLAFSFPLIPR